MTKAKFFGLIAFVGVAMAAAVAFVSYEFGQWSQRRLSGRDVYFVQATLAFAHYKSYERIKQFLERNCYEAALKDATEMKNSQVVLLSDNLRATEYDQELLEYVNLRDPELLKNVLAGQVPELRSYDTPCTGPECECK